MKGDIKSTRVGHFSSPKMASTAQINSHCDILLLQFFLLADPSHWSESLVHLKTWKRKSWKIKSVATLLVPRGRKINLIPVLFLIPDKKTVWMETQMWFH